MIATHQVIRRWVSIMGGTDYNIPNWPQDDWYKFPWDTGSIKSYNNNLVILPDLVPHDSRVPR